MKLLYFVLALCSSSIYAATPTLLNLTETEATNAIEDFNSSFVPTSVSGASSLGTVFGLQLGAVGGTSDAPNLKSLAAGDGGEEFSSIPMGAVLLQVGAPFGLGVEVGLLPIDLGDFKYSLTTIGLRWTFTDIIDVIPFDMKLQYDFTTAEIQYNQSESGASSTVKLDSDVTKFALTLSKKLVMVEPYAVIGYASADTKLSYSGSVSVLSFATSVDKDSSDVYLAGGVEFDLFVMRTGIEFSQVFDNSRIAGKLTLGF